MTDRTPPHDLLAEQAVLGGIMSATTVVDQHLLLAEVQGILAGPGDFYRPAHQIIFGAMVSLSARHDPLDIISVHAELDRQGETARTGGAVYLTECTSTIPAAVNTGYYAKIVADKAVLRRLIEVGTRIAQLGWEQRGDVEDLVDAARALVTDETTTGADRNGDLVHILDDDLWAEVNDEMQRGSTDAGNRVPTGFADLDALTGGGFEAGQLVVIGARPALGKSTIALDFSRGAVKAGHHALFFGLEMSNKEMLQRWIAAEAQVPLHSIRAGGPDMLKDGDWDRIAAARAKAREHQHQLWIADRCNTVAQIRANARRHKAQHGRLDMIVVDYLQLIPTGATAENRQTAVAEASRELKLLAKDMQAVVVMLSQLNRKSEDRQDKRPAIADLRESGAVEQDADVVILLYREDVHDKDSPRAGEADLIVAKHRNGPTCDVTVAFQGHYSRFKDLYQG